MKELQLFSPAKINLFLHITGKRDDGYHNLQSVFRALNFGDTLRFRSKSSGDLVRLFGAENITPNVADNLIIKAVETLAKRFPAYASPVEIMLEKVIPTGAGLGGGSSNCAMTLVALNELWGLRLSAAELIKIGRELGADVPFFIFAHLNGTDAVATGIGDELTAISLPKREYLLLLPDEHLSTAELFASPKLVANTPVIADLQDKQALFLDKLEPPFCNAFEPIAVAQSAKVAEALTYLQTREADTDTTARMTGTGSVVYLPIVYMMGDGLRYKFIHEAPCQAMIVPSLFS